MAPYNNAPESGTRSGGTAAGRGTGAGALVGGALFVGLIALCALVISYNGIFQFAEYGGHEGSLLAHVFPATYTLLLIMACWVSYLLRGAHPRERFWVDLVLIPALVLFAAAAMLMSNLELIEQVHRGVANVIVAVAPLAALLVAFLLWMTLRAHMRRRRRAQTARPRPADDRTTVLHARAVVPRTGEGQPRRGVEGLGDTLRARLLRLGSENRGDAHGDDRADVRDEDRERPGTPFDEHGRSDGDDNPDEDRTEVFAPVGRPEEEEDEGRRDSEGFRENEEAEEAPEPEGLATDDRHREEDRWGGPEEDAHASVLDMSSPERHTTPPEPEDDDEDEFASSVPTFRLPRRSQSERNPIRRAVEQTPVVPGAAAPAAFEPAPEPVGPEPVPDHLADEGFDHQPPFGDPVSDEADAPPEPTHATESEPGHGSAAAAGREPVPATAFGPRNEPSTAHGRGHETAAEPRPEHGPLGATEHAAVPAGGLGQQAVTASEPGRSPEPTAESGHGAVATPEPGPGHEPAVAVQREPESVAVPVAEELREPEPLPDPAAEDGPEHVPTTTSVDTNIPDTARWEPPEDDSGAHVLADYVPPVWTPPEDDPSPFAEEYREPEPTPALDHDTGPEVRAAFRIRDDMPPGAAQPSDEPVEPAPRLEAASRHEPDALQEPEPLPEPETPASAYDLPPEAEALSPTGYAESGTTPEPPPAPETSPGTGTAPVRHPAPGRRRPPLEKRPMVLKPPRPPMPDFAAGPPSRRVRSEPLRPEE